jgi:hypothetical protein
MRTALKVAGNPSAIVVYPEAGHAAQDAWTRMLAWFNQHGAA